MSTVVLERHNRREGREGEKKREEGREGRERGETDTVKTGGWSWLGRRDGKESSSRDCCFGIGTVSSAQSQLCGISDDSFTLRGFLTFELRLMVLNV